jgi:WD40 repeat protein
VRGYNLLVSHHRSFRVFVSSTFADLVEERNALQRRVWPLLTEACAKLGFRFQAIDLRWGISEEATLDHRTSRICLEELERCRSESAQPNFIVLLGNRYGWRPLPAEIAVSEFEKIEKKAENLRLPNRELLRTWYRRDDNAIPPVYYLRRRVREEDADYTRSDVWNTDIENPLRNVLATCASEIPIPDARIKYDCSLVEREILAGALDPALGDANEYVFAYLREVQEFDRLISAPAVEAAELSKYVDFENATHCDRAARERLRDLKSRLDTRLGPEHVRRYEAGWRNGAISQEHLDALCNDVLADLTKVMDREISRFVARSTIAVEIEAHERFRDSHGSATNFRGRADIRSRISAYLADIERNRPLVIWGPSGSGKTSLLARAATEAVHEYSNAVVIQRFIGATPQSTDGWSLLYGLCEELGQKFQTNASIPIDYRELVSAFRERLSLATSETPVIIFLDAIDQMSDDESAVPLCWLPQQLPPHVRLVVSVMENAGNGPTHAGNKSGAIADPLMIIRSSHDRMTDLLAVEDYSAEDARALLDYWLISEHRRVTKIQSELIMTAFQRCPRPLFLRLAAGTAKHWRSDGPAHRMPTGDSPDAMLGAMIDQSFDSLSKPENHGELLVERVLGYLVAARNGLAENEFIGLLSADREFFDAFLARSISVGQSLPEGVNSLPVVVWARLYADLGPYLSMRQVDGTVLFAFYHQSLELAAKRRFLSPPDIAAERHKRIAQFFTPAEPNGFFRITREQQRLLATKPLLELRPVNIRVVVELPYQLLQVARLLGQGDARSSHWDKVEELLLNTDFLEAKAEYSLLQSLIPDYQRAIDLLPNQHPCVECLSQVAEVISRNRRFISSYPTMLFQTVWNGLYNTPPVSRGPGVAVASRRPADLEPQVLNFLERWREKRQTQATTPPMWFRSITPDNSTGSGIRSFEGHLNRISCIAFSGDGHHVVSGSWDRLAHVLRAPSAELVSVLRGRRRPRTPEGVGGWSVGGSPPSGGLLAVAVTSDGMTAATAGLPAQDNDQLEHIDAFAELLRGDDASASHTIHKPVSGLQVWDTRTGEEFGPFIETDGAFRAVCFSKCERFLIGIGDEGSVVLWSRSTYEVLARYPYIGPMPTCLSALNSGVLIGFDDGSIRHFSTPQLDGLGKYSTDDDGIDHIAAQSDGTFAFFATSSGRVYKIFLPSAELQFVEDFERQSVVGLVIAESVGLISACSRAGNIIICDTGLGSTVYRGQLNQACGSYALSPDGKFIAYGGEELDPTLRIRPSESVDVAAPPGHPEVIQDIVFSPDGRWLAFGGGDAKVHIWDAELGCEYVVFESERGRVFGLAFSPDSSLIACAYRYGSVAVWRVNEKTLMHDLPSSFMSHFSVRFSPDGRYVESSHGLWEVESGEPAYELPDSLAELQEADDNKTSPRFGQEFEQVRNDRRGWDVLQMDGFTYVLDSVQQMLIGVVPHLFSRVALGPGGRLAGVDMADFRTLRLFQLEVDHYPRESNVVSKDPS